MASNEDSVRLGSMRFESVLQADVPTGRDGKHKQIITQLLSDIDQLKVGSALKVPLADLPDSKENIRSALSRAAAQRKLNIATSSNDEFLFVWKTDPTA
jgi:TusA-related sulfurtransferase